MDLKASDCNERECNSGSKPVNSYELHHEDEYTHVVPGLIYIETSCAGEKCDSELFESTHSGCNCNVICDKKCSCGVSYLDNKISWNYFKPILECNDLCSCDISCHNRMVQKGPLKNLEIRKTNNKGFGLYTKTFIPNGTFVCEYAGEYISREAAQTRFASLTAEDSNYILVINEYSSNLNEVVNETIIDPTYLGNIGRYINHSCDPNMKIVPIRINSLLPIAALFTVKDILPDTELCYSYNSNSFSNKLETNGDGKTFLSSKKCLCNTNNCLGFLPSGDVFNFK